MSKVMHISVNGIEMPCSVFGEGKKTAIILPGLSVKNVCDTVGAVAAQYRILAADYTVYVIDRRSNAPEDYSILRMAEDTAAVMKELGLREAYVLGASQGGMIGICLAAGHPELVKRLAVASSAARGSTFSDKVFERWIDLARRRERTELTRDFLAATFSPRTFSTFGNVFEMLGRSFTDSELEHFIIIAQALVGSDVTKELRAVRCPILNIGSTGDMVFGEAGCREITENSACESYIYTGDYGHAVYDEAKDFTERIYNFFAE